MNAREASGQRPPWWPTESDIEQFTEVALAQEREDASDPGASPARPAPLRLPTEAEIDGYVEVAVKLSDDTTG